MRDHRYVYALRLRSAVDTVLESEFIADTLAGLTSQVPVADDVVGVAASLDVDQTDNVLYYGRTFAFDWARLRLRLLPDGSPRIVSGSAALLEDIHKALLTPRFRVPIYDTDYGAEFEDLQGLDRPTAEAQVGAMIREALLVDPRVSAVEMLVDPERAGDGGMAVTITVTDFTGAVLDVPDLMLLYGG